MKDKLRLSVIIPTYNRVDILPRCLHALNTQTIPGSDFEIIIVDDGSTDNTEQVVSQLKDELIPEVTYIKQENKGPAGARNTGIRLAKGTIIWITGDDYIAEPDCLQQHLDWHENRNPGEETTILGYSTWDPELTVKPLMHWVENGGFQFAYHTIRHGEEISFIHFITCNISFKKSFFDRFGPFDETYLKAMGEDTDLGIRFALNGMRFYYNSQAVAYHYHPIAGQDQTDRMHLLGEMLAVQEDKWPRFHIFRYQEVYKRLTSHAIVYIHSRFQSFLKHIPKKLNDTLDRHAFRSQEYIWINQGIRDGIENLTRRGMSKPAPDDEVVLVVPLDDDLNVFYRHINRVKTDFKDAKIVFVGLNCLRTDICLKHPGIDWFLFSQYKPHPLQASVSLYKQIRELKCSNAAIIFSLREFDFSTFLFFKLCGIKNIFAYTPRGERIAMKTGGLLRLFFRFEPSLMTVVWETSLYFKELMGIIWKTVMAPINLFRWIVCKIFLR